ncbi:hypothetical protein GF354_04905 [Candidatus Peregrinibacteria bacterium]|nr:hypothetical protein [Candidatus Peregrinibacteria bacterium]
MLNRSNSNTISNPAEISGYSALKSVDLSYLADNEKLDLTRIPHLTQAFNQMIRRTIPNLDEIFADALRDGEHLGLDEESSYKRAYEIILGDALYEHAESDVNMRYLVNNKLRQPIPTGGDLTNRSLLKVSFRWLNELGASIQAFDKSGQGMIEAVNDVRTLRPRQNSLQIDIATTENANSNLDEVSSKVEAFIESVKNFNFVLSPETEYSKIWENQDRLIQKGNKLSDNISKRKNLINRTYSALDSILKDIRDKYKNYKDLNLSVDRSSYQKKFANVIATIDAYLSNNSISYEDKVKKFTSLRVKVQAFDEWCKGVVAHDDFERLPASLNPLSDGIKTLRAEEAELRVVNKNRKITNDYLEKDYEVRFETVYKHLNRFKETIDDIRGLDFSHAVNDLCDKFNAELAKLSADWPSVDEMKSIINANLVPVALDIVNCLKGGKDARDQELSDKKTELEDVETKLKDARKRLVAFQRYNSANVRPKTPMQVLNHALNGIAPGQKISDLEFARTVLTEVFSELLPGASATEAKATAEKKLQDVLKIEKLVSVGDTVGASEFKIEDIVNDKRFRSAVLDLQLTDSNNVAYPLIEFKRNPSLLLDTADTLDAVDLGNGFNLLAGLELFDGAKLSPLYEAVRSKLLSLLADHFGVINKIDNYDLPSTKLLIDAFEMLMKNARAIIRLSKSTKDISAQKTETEVSTLLNSAFKELDNKYLDLKDDLNYRSYRKKYRALLELKGHEGVADKLVPYRKSSQKMIVNPKKLLIYGGKLLWKGVHAVKYGLWALGLPFGRLINRYKDPADQRPTKFWTSLGGSLKNNFSGGKHAFVLSNPDSDIAAVEQRIDGIKQQNKAEPIKVKDLNSYQNQDFNTKFRNLFSQASRRSII